MKHKKIRYNTAFKRTVAFVTSLTILASSVCFPGIGDSIRSVFNAITASAEVVTVRNETVRTLKELYEFSERYQLNPRAYSRTNLTIRFDDNEISSTKTFDGVDYTWYPIGTAECPFNGRIMLTYSSAAAQPIVVNEPLFAYITDSVEFVNITPSDGRYVPQDIILKRNTDSSKPLLAENVVHDSDATSTPANWRIHIQADESYGGLLGTVGENVNVNVNLDVVSSPDIVSDDNAGLICQTMEADSTVNVNILSSCGDTSVDVESTGGNAGAFAGEMMPGSVLNISPGNYIVSNSSRTISAKNYAGGLVGKNDQATIRFVDFERDTNGDLVFDASGNYTIVAQTDGNGDPVTDTNGDPVYAEQVYDALGTIKSTDGAAGGVFGYFKVRTDNNRFSPDYYLSTTGCTLNGKTAGGLIGELDGNGLDMSYSGTSASDRASVVSVVSGSHTTYGGIVGSYSNSALTNTFTIEHTAVTISGGSAATYGGAVGTIGGSSPLYVKVNDFTLNATGSVNDCTYFGGVVGSAGDKGSMLDIGDVTVTTTNKYKGGGVVGQLSEGVLRLSGTTDLSSTDIASGGQLVGERKNALVFALGNGSDADGTSYEQGWRFVRSTTDPGYDDIGTWGEVVRISGVETKDPAVGDDTSSSILVYNSTAHTVTVASHVQDMRSAADFTRTALNMQLNDGNKGALLFSSGSKRSTLLANQNLTVFGTIDLAGTGITGFMRDGSTGSGNDGTEIKAFTGKLSKGEAEEGEDDADAVINLAVGERYGVYSGAANGRGAIYKHRFNGLFARTDDGAAIENITVGGYMNVRGLTNDMYIGGAAAYVKDSLTLTDVKTTETINYAHLGTVTGHYVGGLIGATNCAAGKTVTIEGSDSDDKVSIAPIINVTGTGVSNVNDKGNTNVSAIQCVGGVIGYISSTAVASTDIKNITLSATVDASEAGSADYVSVAGMIADIAFYSNFGTDTRTLNFENIDIIGTVVKNKANNASGGILGYRWPGTDVNFNNVVLATGTKDNEINTTAAYIGGLVYKATGNWYVPSGGINIQSLAIKNGNSAAAPTSLGIIVHDGYMISDDDTCGIFLEMTASDSYTLARELTIPTMSSNYDELVFALSNDYDSLLTNNTAGVISYATDGGVYTSAEGIKNSYNNVYNTTVVNNRSRYYYNADRDSYANNSSDDDGYKLLFWSLNRYAASNIKRCFTNPFSTDVLTGTFDLMNISYYPIDISSKVTLSDADIIFYNSEIETAETASDTERSTRDATSQHYLMHMGLFKNVSSTVETTGDITMYGSVGVNATYSGALINGTLTGTLKTAQTKNIILGYSKSSRVKYPLSIVGDNTDERFLLINSIGSKAVLELNGVGIDEGGRYSPSYNTDNNRTYASSLIGNVQGIGITLKFNNIKLDSRNTENVASPLDDFYGTSRSIFRNATLLNKYDVDSTSVAIYNFSQSEDWDSVYEVHLEFGETSPKGVTYGKELTDTVEYRDLSTNLSEENRYYEDGEAGNFIDPENYPTASTKAYTFSTNFLPYVRYYNGSVSGAPAEPQYTLREIKVNVIPSDLTSGCGTYDHPYEITAAKQLVAVANMLDADDGYIPIPNIMLPTNKTDTSHWCLTDATTHSCKLFSYDGSTYYTSTETTTKWNKDEVRAYLAKAYYEIGQDLVLGASFHGLGDYSSTYAFKGVIVGKNSSITITNKSTVPFIKISNGSVVKDLNIVVDNYANKAHQQISYSGDSSSFFSYANNDLVYGGLIGKIMGGDNIIDNVSITYSSNNTAYIKVQNKHLSCIGGYVGAVVNGGLIFRNMTASSFVSRSTFNVNSANTPGTTNWVSEDNKAHLFVNPYVGRVINGYAINETTTYSGDTGNYTLDNGTKNYQICDVKVNVTDASDATSEKLFYTVVSASKNHVNIPTGQSLFILSLITQSGAGTATTATGNYAYGVGYDGTTKYNDTSAAANVATHIAQYDKVGTITFAEKTASGSDYVVSTGDKLNDKTATPYIITHYTRADSGSYPARMMTGNTEFMKLSTANGTYNLPKSFRGIGSICYGGLWQTDNNPYQMHIYGFDGNGSTINVNTLFNTYYFEKENYATTVYGRDTNTSGTKYAPNINLGIGLFNVLIQKPYSNTTKYKLDDGYYIGKFTLSGEVTVNEYNENGVKQSGDLSTGENGNSRNRYAVGGLTAGILPGGYANLYDLDLNDLKLTGTTYVAGYIGRNNITEKNAASGGGASKIYVNGCDTTATVITGSNGCCGGIVGGSISGYPSIYVNTAKLKSGDTHDAGDDGYYKTTMELSISCDSDTGQSGIGGIIGTLRNGYGVVFWVNNVTVIGGGTTKGFINNSTTAQGTFTQGAGGLFGFARKADSIIVTNCEVSNLKVKAPLAGGLFGNIDFYDDKGTYGTSPVIKIANCKVSSDDASTYYIEGIKGAGGITGQFTSSKAYDKTVVGYDATTVYSYDVDGCEISKYTISQTGDKDELCGAGGLFGFARATYVSATDAKMRTVVNTSVHDCIIKTDGSKANHGMGAVIGCVPTIGSSTSNSASIVIDDSGTKKSTAKACGNVGAYNVACYNNSFAFNGSGTSAKVGNFVGQSNGSVFKVVGFTRKNNTFNGNAYSADYGGDVNSASYFIDADYKNISTTDDHGIAMAVGFDNGTNVGEGARTNYFPYVTVSPKTVMGDPSFLTGDGVSTIEGETADAKVPLAKLITDENIGTAAENRIAYKTVSNEDIAIVQQLITWGEDTTSDHDIKLTTYGKEMGLPDGYDAKNGVDFPILAINGAETSGYNDYINAYIRTLTNTTDDYSVADASKYKVDIYACQCINGVYQKVSGSPGFSLNSSRKFVMDDSAADSIADNDQISMIDISFFDPTDNTKTAYHLYIPVLTKKLLKFDFNSTALQGTEYEPSEYLSKFPTEAGATTKLAAGFDSWQTIYVQFSYSPQEINKFLTTGKGLMWNTSKSLYFKYNSKQTLALTTEFVLLDNNYNVDKEYYKTKAAADTVTKSNGMSDDIIHFSDFKASDGTTGFTPQNLNYIADKNVVYTPDNTADGVYASCDENDPDMVAFAYDSSGDNKLFFKKRTTEANGYTLSISESIKETYYLSMYAYKKDNPRAKQSEIMTATVNDAYGFTVTCPITFTGDVITCQMNSSHDTEIYLGTFLKQTISLSEVTTTRDIAASDSHVIHATMTSELSFDGNDAGYFHTNLEGEHIYQGFYLYLNRYDDDGKPVSDCSIKGQPTYNYSRSRDGNLIGSGTSLVDENAPYIEIDPIDITIPAYNSTWKSTQVVPVTVDYGTNEAGIISEFPARTDPMDTNSGIGFVAKTRLEFAESRVKYSNMVNVYDSNYQRYYRDKRATDGELKLTAIDQPGNDGYDVYGEQSHNKSPLGVNAKYISTGSEYDEDFGDFEFIKVGMDYDVSNLNVEEVFDGTHNLNIKIELEQKIDDENETAGFKYIPVNIDDTGGANTGYLKDFVFYGREGQEDLDLVTESDSNHYYYTYSMELDPETIDEWAIRYTDTGAIKSFDGNLGFYVKTNEELEKVTGYRYANYRLKMTVSISDTSYSNFDCIVYTNAKVNAQFVKVPTLNPSPSP